MELNGYVDVEVQTELNVIRVDEHGVTVMVEGNPTPVTFANVGETLTITLGGRYPLASAEEQPEARRSARTDLMLALPEPIRMRPAPLNTGDPQKN